MGGRGQGRGGSRPLVPPRTEWRRSPVGLEEGTCASVTPWAISNGDLPDGCAASRRPMALDPMASHVQLTTCRRSTGAVSRCQSVRVAGLHQRSPTHAGRGGRARAYSIRPAPSLGEFTRLGGCRVAVEVKGFNWSGDSSYGLVVPTWCGLRARWSSRRTIRLRRRTRGSVHRCQEARQAVNPPIRTTRREHHVKQDRGPGNLRR